VLLTGESGTGKDLAAKVLHYASDRAARPFMNITCSAIPEQILESELFGHERGAFTDARQQKRGLLESADGGTVFLDEIGEMAPGLQSKLLRFLEEKTFKRVGGVADIRVDVRVIAATNRNLEDEVKKGRFREDLYYRLAVVEARIPSLRERKEDIPLLVESFLGARAPPASLAGLPPETLPMLQAHQWPGNVRELRNAVARLMVLPPHLFAGGEAEAMAAPTGAADRGDHLIHLPLREARELVVADFERAYLTAQLRKHGGGAAAARAMGVSRQLVHRLMQEYGLSPRDE
jgi:transcriptional regulator with PAS, ATPase and Fis domain